MAFNLNDVDISDFLIRLAAKERPSHGPYSQKNDWWVCPSCLRRVEVFDNYCSYCGQRLAWVPGDEDRYNRKQKEKVEGGAK